MAARSPAAESKKSRDGLSLITTNDTPLAQAVRHSVIPLILASFGALFSRLVADPVGTMQVQLAAVTVIQVASAPICYPVAGSARYRKPRPGEKKKKDASSSAGPSVLLTTLLSTLLTAFTVPALHIALVLFGAPFLTHMPHTLLAAAHFAVLALFPLFFVHGVDSSAWISVGACRAPLDETFGGLVGATLGTWLGAVPIPLDWDREWQKWPVTILCGMYAGYSVGRVLGGTLLFGKRFS